MIKFRKKNIHSNKTEANKNRGFWRSRYTYFIFVMVLTCFLPVTSATADITTGALCLNYNGRDINYTGTQGKVTINGGKIKLGTIPVIIVDDTALLPAWKVFVRSSVKAGYSYHKNTNQVTLKKGGTVIELTIGSKTAYVNGEEKILDTPPLFVTNTSSQETSVMVPGNFIATNLGYQYIWNKETKTSQITQKKNNGESSSGKQKETGSTALPDETFFQWGLMPELSESYTLARNAVNTTEVSTDEGTLSHLEAIKLTQVLNGSSPKEVYTIKAASPLSKTTINTEGNILKLHINNSYVDSVSTYLGGVLASEYNAVYHAIENYSELTLRLSHADTKYQVTLSQDKCTLTITLYPNYINAVTAGRRNGEEYINITTMEDLSVTLTESGNSLILQMPYTVNGVGNQSTTSAFKAVKAVKMANMNDYTAGITIEKGSGYSHRVERDKNSYTILFSKDASSGTGENTEDNTQFALQFKLPQGINYSDITTEDRYRYYQNKIAILLPGDHTDFYDANPVTVSSEVVQDVSVDYVNNQTEIVIDTSKLQGFRLTEAKKVIGVTLGDPREIYQNIVLLDPGHGGTASGATRTLHGEKIMEKDIALEILYHLAQKYFNSPDSPIKVYYTRYGDEERYTNVKKELRDRAARSQLIGADLYVSLHMNSHTTSTPTGTEVYYSSVNNQPNEAGLTSKKMAEMFLNNLTANLGTVRRGVKAANHVVTKENTVPAVLIELGFMSNQQELALLNDPEFQEKAAKTIYDTLCQVFEAYPTGR